MESGAPLAEPGFAWAMYYRLTKTGDAKHDAAGRKAIAWALAADRNPVTDLRQLALVFDWCGSLFTKTDADALAAKLQQGLAQPSTTVSGQNSRALAAIALADRLPDAGNAILLEIVQSWWRGQVVPRLAAGQQLVSRDQFYLLLEMMHAIRDNTKVDLRESAIEYFTQLPLDYLAGHYPAPFPGSQNDLRVPAYVGNGDPDPAAATRDRAAGLALVAYDTNALNQQFVQGWLMNDRYQLHDALGAPYEFLWANPYQPGLSYQTLPLVFHDPETGHVFARTSWEDNASWIGYFEGTLQLFQNNGVQTLRPGSPLPRPVKVGTTIISRATEPDAAKLRMDSETLFLLGLAPRAEYGVEIDDRELDLIKTDVGGTLVVKLPEAIDTGVRVQKR
jgi:hypothetical protein